jgi:hypothetical protein
MTTKRALLVSIIILAGVSLVGAQSPISPNASPEASASPAKKVRKKKAEASPAPATSPEASASPAKTRGRKKAETSPAPAASPEASASPAKARGRKKAEVSPTASPAASASPANPLSKIGNLFKPRTTASPTAKTTSSAEANATPAAGGGHGLVWVNTESHVYHKEGSRFYGKTKQGKYVSEADAIKEGDRASKTND